MSEKRVSGDHGQVTLALLAWSCTDHELHENRAPFTEKLRSTDQGQHTTQVSTPGLGKGAPQFLNSRRVIGDTRTVYLHLIISFLFSR